MNLYNLLTKDITQQELLNYYNANIEYINIPFHNTRGFVDYYNDMYFIYIDKNLSDYKKKENNITRISTYRIKSAKSNRQ